MFLPLPKLLSTWIYRTDEVSDVGTFAHAAGSGSYGPPRHGTEDGSMGKLGIQRAQIGPYAPRRRRIWLGLA